MKKILFWGWYWFCFGVTGHQIGMCIARVMSAPRPQYLYQTPLVDSEALEMEGLEGVVEI